MSNAETIKVGVGKKVVTAKAPKAAHGYDPDAKIVLIVKENPRREGTDVHAQFELMRKAKTVGDYWKAGGRTGTLRKCITKKWAKLA